MERSDQRTPRPRLRLWTVMAGALLLLVGGSGLAFTLFRKPPMVSVDGHQVVSNRRHETVADLLRKAHIHPGPGMVLTVVTHRPIRGHAVPPIIRVDGRSARLSSLVRPGARVVANPGTVIEPLVARDVPIGLAGLPDIEFYLWHPGTQAVMHDLVGAYSGQVLSSTVAVPERSATPVVDREVALTFDDGPDPRWTPQVLQILRANGVRATFCAIGYKAAAHPELILLEARAGMSLCDHTWDHDVRLAGASPRHIREEITAADTEITKDSGGVPPVFYRPPGGHLSPTIIQTAHGIGLRVLYWSVDTADWQRPPPAMIVRRALQAGPGAIVLLHDGGGDRSGTVAALPLLIAELRAAGCTFTTPALVLPKPAPVGVPIPVTPIPKTIGGG